MTDKEAKDVLESYFLVEGIDVEEGFLDGVVKLLRKSNYLQLLYNYGVHMLLTILKIYEEIELYEECAKIKQTIEDSNKLENRKLPTHYREL